MKGWMALLILAFMFVVACGHRTEVRFPMLNTIERGIEVTGFENKFIHIEAVGWGGAGAGGLGAPQIFAESAAQFTSLVPPGEPIYTYWEKESTSQVNKKYMAFIENRAGVILWDDVYNAGWACKFEYVDIENNELVWSDSVDHFLLGEESEFIPPDGDEDIDCFEDDVRAKRMGVWDDCDDPIFRNHRYNIDKCEDWPGVHRAR